MTNTRRFQVAEGREVVLPQGLQTAPGANTMRARPGEILEIHAERCNTFQRFIAGRLRAGDITEVGPDATGAAPVAEVAPAAPVDTLEMPAPTAGKGKR